MTTTIYRVKSAEFIHPHDPLHVGKFYPYQERIHPAKNRERQALILYLARIHSAAVQSGKPVGFCRIPMRLTTLREWVYDFKVVFDKFFDIVQEGYYVNEDVHDISVVTPKRLEAEDLPIAKKKLVYDPPELPKEGVVSKVYVQQQNRATIMTNLFNTGRLDLVAPVEWLLDQSEVNFYFSPSGRLQKRDTSTWPIAAIETWPSWLREELFGAGIDIESAYTQFLIEGVRKAYGGREAAVSLLFPDLLRSLEDKQKWRRELCEDVLGLPWNDDNVGVVKKICMSLANGSKISPGILLSAMGHSMTRDIVLQETSDQTATNLIAIGNRLQRISRQYDAAKSVVCTAELGIAPTRKNKKLVFASYFDWEREARYKIWEAVGRHGVMVHDGIDGIPEEFLADIPALISALNIRLTRS